MDWNKLRLKTDKGLRKALAVVAPAAKVVGEATKIISTIQKPGLIAVTNAVTSGLGTLSDLVAQPDEAPGWVVATHLSQGMLEAAFAGAGWRRELGKGEERGKMLSRFEYTEGKFVRADGSGQVWIWESRSEAYQAVRLALDAYLPRVLRLQINGSSDKKDVAIADELTPLTPVGTAAITARTLSLLGRGRAILLEGKPGVGKTTMAQAIARDSGLGRVVMLDNTFLAARTNSESLEMLNAAVIIVDDIDKVTVSLSAFERVRAACKLLICTANNGTFDSVIDAALARPARLDEVFTIEHQAPFQRAPFDRLPAKVWSVVSEWPQAYLNELELRLNHTPNDLRINDLQGRLGRRTRSVEGMMGDASGTENPDLEKLLDQDPDCLPCSLD